MTEASLDLTGHFLIAMPSMEDDLFEGCVVYVFDHNEDGAVGLIVNQPSTVAFSELLGDVSQFGISEEELEKNIADTIVYFGGPAHPDKGFVLHSPDKTYRSTIGNKDLLMTSSRDVLIGYAKGDKPKQFLIALGYAGWSAGQLEDEIARNEWLTVEASSDVIFKHPVGERYRQAIKLLGFDPASLQTEVGNA